MKMASPHPRRRSKVPQTGVTLPEDISPQSRPVTRSSVRNMSLRKGSTFHTPTTPQSEVSQPLPIPSLPKRSETCPKDLDVIAGSEARMAALIGTLDRSLTCSGSMSPGVKESLRQEALPLPRIVLDATVSEPPTQLDAIDLISNTGSGSSGTIVAREVNKHHTSDSGIGSTVSGSVRTSSVKDESSVISPSITSRRTHAAACLGATPAHHSPTLKPAGDSKSSTRSVCGRQRLLSPGAAMQIQRRIIHPLLKTRSLKHFHPLVHETPARITKGEIICLRDLEKFLIHLAPTRAKSAASYLEFCEISIRCVRDTVERISESDQRRPYDRPYTDGYFLDLVEQIRQYARTMIESKERETAGEKADEADLSPSEKLVLDGGLSQTGRPAQLVRVKNGKTIPIGTGSQRDDPKIAELEAAYKESKFHHGPAGHTFKRQLSEHSSDEESSVLRSMARRRKVSPQAAREVPVQVCDECGKQYKRPCDLTKHEKTHSRPWKCSEPTCKYSTHGWPTEKERDRHVNDKHSDTPAMYECHFSPCTYKSKRESNCKQHMEKAHDWKYIRSKKTRGMSTSHATNVENRTADFHELATPISFNDAAAPMTRDQSYDNEASGDYSMAGSTSGSEGVAPYSRNAYSEAQHPPFVQPADEFDFNDYQNPYNPTDAMQMPSVTPYTFPLAAYLPPDVSMDNSSTGANSLENSIILSDNNTLPNIYDAAIDWAAFDNIATNLETYPVLTPDNSPCTAPAPYPTAPIAQSNQVPGLSPGAQGNQLLYSPESAPEIADEGYDEFLGTSGKPVLDFQLYPSGSSGSRDGISENMFPAVYRQPVSIHGHYPHMDMSQGYPEYMMPWDSE